MMTALFVGGPLHGQLMILPEHFRSYHAPMRPQTDWVLEDSMLKPMRMEIVVYYRRFYSFGGREGIAFVLEGLERPELHLAEALAG